MKLGNPLSGDRINVMSSVVLVLLFPCLLLAQSYPVVDTGQEKCYDNSAEISAPSAGDSFYGQDAQYQGNQPEYQDNGDGTVTDLVTGLMWQKTPDRNGDGIIDYDDKLLYDEAVDSAASCNLAGYNDWRLPTIKEQYSLIMFYGAEPNPSATSQGSAVPYIDTEYFDFGYGDLSVERIIDAQYATSTIYVSTTMGGDKTMFGVNFADGRIKGYPAEGPMWKKYCVMYVRGNPNYGKNEYVDNGDGTITDKATGLMWMQNDNGEGVLWKNALSYAEGFEYAGYTDWRLPNAKELQSIVDYTRSPSTTGSAAIDSLFNCTQITNEAGEADYPFYWTGTTFCSQSTARGTDAVYVSFGRAMGYMNGSWIDVHGAGAQRSDPKEGDPNDYLYGHGPQGDAIRIYNYVRCVRGGDITVPVELSNFEATVEGNDVLLMWTTVSESNNYGFEVQRGLDDHTFVKVAYVGGSGTSSVSREYSYRDEDLAAGTYYYRLRQIDLDGHSQNSGVVEVTVSAPASFSLLQNYPNPFNPETTISFSLPRADRVMLEIFNVLGEHVATLADGYLPAGNYRYQWVAIGQPSGVYYCRLVYGTNADTKKMMLMQ